MLSIPHLIVIFVVALVIFGPEKLPELARNLGKVMAEFRRATGDLRTTFEGHLRDIEREGETRRIASPDTPRNPPAPPPSIETVSASSTLAPSSPGTIPSNPPNAAATAVTSGELFPEPPADPDDMKSRDIGHDPYLMGTEFAPVESRHEPEPAKSETSDERVSDGDQRPS
jgi:sec-independent protein translocase protein TatB